MSDVISLKKAERNIFLRATQDGLTDIFIGCIFLIFAIAPFLSISLGDFWSTVVFIPFWAVIAIGIWLIRRYVVKPRIGEVRFGAARKTRLRKFSVVMLCVNVIALLLGIWASFNSEVLPGRLISMHFGFLCLALFSIAAYFLNYRRLYVYGLLVGLSPMVGEWLWVRGLASHHGFPITFGVVAGIMILTGLYVFVHFLKDNPVPGEGNPAGEE